MSYNSLIDSVVARPQHTDTEAEKQRMLADPTKIERAVANMADYYSPTASAKKPKGDVYGVDSVEASKDPGDPTIGFGHRLREEFSTALLDPRNKGVSAGQLLHGISGNIAYTPDETGKSLIEKSHEFNRTEDSRLWGGVPRKPLPGYNSWLRDKQLQEKQESDKESWLPTKEDLATGTGLGALFGGVAGAVGGGIPGAAAGAGVGATTGLALGGPVGAVAGAGLGALAGVFGGAKIGAAAGAATGAAIGFGGEVLAAPIKKLVHKTDWYHGMVASNSVVDNAKAMLADVAAYIPGALVGGAGYKAIGDKAFGSLSMKGLGESLVEGKVPRGPGIEIGGESNLSRPPMKQLPYEPTKMTTPGSGILYDAEGNIIMQPAEGGARTGAQPTMRTGGGITPSGLLDEGATPIHAGAPDVPPTGFEPELPKLVGAGKGYEWPGMKNLNRAEDVSPFGVEDILPTAKAPKSQLLLDDLRGEDLEDFNAFARQARGKVYSDLITPDGSSPVLTEQQLFDSWKMMAAKEQRPFNPYADMRAVDNIEKSFASTAKAKESIAATPTANNIVETVTKKPTEIKPVAGSNLVELSQDLSPKGLQETGLEAITDPDVVLLNGTLPNKIKQANERDSFIKLGQEEQTGELRSSIIENSKKEMAEKLTPIKLESPAVAEEVDLHAKMTEVNPDVVVTPKQQEKAVKTTMDFTRGEKSIVEEFFPEAKPSPIEDIKLKYYESLGVKNDAERMTQIREEAISNLEADRRNTGSKTPVSEKEIAREAALIKKDEVENFKFWADDNGIELPSDANKKGFKLIAGMAAFGLSAGIFADHLSGNKADAGWLTASVETVAKKAALVEKAFQRGLISEAVKPGQTVMGKTNFQSGLILDKAEVAQMVQANIRKDTGAGVQYSLMSPYQTIEALFKTGAGKLVNAATNLASFVTAGARTKDNAIKIVKNVLDEAGVKVAANQVKEAMTPLIPLGAKATKADIATAQLKEAEKRLAELVAKVDVKDPVASAADVKIQQESIAKLKTTLEGLSGATQEFHSAWENIAKGLAENHSSVRISLALEDPSRQLYPWLPQLSRNEEIAVGKLRGLLDQYQVRLSERGIPTRENYFPHSPHPEMSKIYNAEMKDILGGAPYQKFYSRTENSRALLPDVNYTMNHYLNDIEPRIQNHDFWDKSGWKEVMNSPIIQSNPGLKRAFNSLYEGSTSVPDTWGNTAARRYSEFEAVHKLFLSPSAGLKHLVKMTADIVSAGPTVFAKSLPDTVGYMTRKALNKTFGMSQQSIMDRLAKVGVTSNRFSRQLMDDYMDSAIMSGNMRKYMMDMGIESQEQIFSTAKNLWTKTQDVGSVWINMAELADRATSVSSALQMAGKRGMTVDQAMYGTYDLILKNNFLFNQFNPSWLNNPKIRALFMFQATPFKIFERRLVNAQRSIGNVKSLLRDTQEIVSQPGGWEKVWTDVKAMKAYLREGQSELKSNLIIDTLRNETDFFGTPVIRQLVTDMLTVGAFTYGGAQAGLSLKDHFFHIPFLSTMSEEGKAELAVSPITSATMKGYNAWKSREEGEDFLLGSITRRWLGPLGPLPKTIEKAVKLSNNDIPEIYRKGGGNEYLKYFFGVPGKE